MGIRDKYVYLTTEKEDQTCIGIKGGKFAGVVLKYSDVSIAEKENADGTLPFRFEYDIVDNYNVPKEEFNEEFFELIGDILVDLIENQEFENNT